MHLARAAKIHPPLFQGAWRNDFNHYSSVRKARPGSVTFLSDSVERKLQQQQQKLYDCDTYDATACSSW